MAQWDEHLLDDQKAAASHIGCHARLLAGPGTGKTLTLARRVVYLVTKKDVLRSQILAVTFTRAAAFELRKRISKELEGSKETLPQVSTLHSFALRQLLLNSNLIDSIPQPLRIADDWEERNIIFEDLKVILECHIKHVKEKFNRLSADWQTLDADEEEWEERFPDPRFLSAWRQHRKIFGYTLRSELVYQLKRALEQTGAFSFESEYSHLLVDEYQDLNRCDLAVIYALRDRGLEVFGTGDDDQSIYGFRDAHPEGIRRFEKDYIPSSSLTLETCVRCDRRIIALSQFLASSDLDTGRLEKPLKPRDDAGEGEVHIVRFKDQAFEAKGIATFCRHLFEKECYAPKDILILMRSDWDNCFSSVIEKELENQNIPAAVRAGGTPLDTSQGRIFFSFLRLLAENKDSLALRALLTLRKNGKTGEESYKALYELARKDGKTFSDAAYKVMIRPELIPRLGKRISHEVQEIQKILDKYQTPFENLTDSSDLLAALQDLAEHIIQEAGNRTEVLKFLESVVIESNSTDHVELLRALSSSMEDEEQERDSSSVNIMTMHKAKGLTAKAVIIIAAEDEYIPGKQTGEKEDDERRLLYVSLSRAQHFLIITHCERRVGNQTYTGRRRPSNISHRTLTGFLRDAPVTSEDGANFVECLEAQLKSAQEVN